MRKKFDFDIYEINWKHNYKFLILNFKDIKLTIIILTIIKKLVANKIIKNKCML